MKCRDAFLVSNAMRSEDSWLDGPVSFIIVGRFCLCRRRSRRTQTAERISRKHIPDHSRTSSVSARREHPSPSRTCGLLLQQSLPLDILIPKSFDSDIHVSNFNIIVSIAFVCMIMIASTLLAHRVFVAGKARHEIIENEIQHVAKRPESEYQG